MARHTEVTADVPHHFRTHSSYSDPGRLASCYDALPDDLESLCNALQALLLHMFWIGEQTCGITYERLKASGRQLCEEFSLSTAEERLAGILALDDRPLSEPRSVDRRSIGCCRDYALMLASVLRHRGIPARVRTGVALYFISSEGHLIEDHYITEHWNVATKRWQRTDPQIDDVQRHAVDEGLNTMDLPDDVFLTGWQLLEAVRAERVPESVGFPPRNAGLTYGRNKLFADFASLTGYELPVHAWWGLGEPDSVAPGDDALMDEMIALVQGIERNDASALANAIHLMRAHPRLRMPDGYAVPTYRSSLC